MLKRTIYTGCAIIVACLIGLVGYFFGTLHLGSWDEDWTAKVPLKWLTNTRAELLHDSFLLKQSFGHGHESDCQIRPESEVSAQNPDIIGRLPKRTEAEIKSIRQHRYDGVLIQPGPQFSCSVDVECNGKVYQAAVEMRFLTPEKAKP